MEKVVVVVIELFPIFNDLDGQHNKTQFVPPQQQQQRWQRRRLKSVGGRDNSSLKCTKEGEQKYCC